MYIIIICDHIETWEANCPHWEWAGDGSCDDATNTILCNYDGGDCCGSNVDVNYCTQCLCLTNSSTLTPVPITFPPSVPTITLTPGNNTGNPQIPLAMDWRTKIQQV